MTVSNLAELLDATDPVARIEYERAFYAAFQRVSENRLVRRLWRFDDGARQIATRVPYSHQRIYIDRRGGAIECAIAVNVRLDEFQSAMYGFKAPDDPTGACEFLTFFSVSGERLARQVAFRRSCLGDLYARGFYTGYTTVGPRMFHAYTRLRFGATLMDEAEIDGERRYFLSIDLERASAPRQSRPVAAFALQDRERLEESANDHQHRP